MVQTAEGSAPWVRVDELTRAMARDFMHLEAGQRLPTVRELAGRYGASLGSIQAAIARLEGEGAIRVTRRARMGAHLVDVSFAGLWSIAEGAPLILALPLPSNLRGQGLATGIKSALEEHGLDTFLTFVRGSRNRLRALREGRCHIVVMSGLAATISREPGLRITLLPEHTFAEQRRVFLHRPENGSPAGRRRPLRVVIDSQSADLQYIAELEFAEQDVEFVPAVYMQSIALIESGSADAAVWDLDENTRRLPPHVVSRPLADHVRALVGDTDTRAAIVTREAQSPADLVVQRCLRPERIVEVQQGVLEGRIVPGY